MQSPFQPSSTPEESYCVPWNLKLQEEKLKLLNEQRRISSLNTIITLPSNINDQSSSLSFNDTLSNKTSSARPSSLTKRSLTHREPLPSCQCNTGNLNPPTLCSGTDTSRSFLFASTSTSDKPVFKIDKNTTQPMSFKTAVLHFKRLSSSIQNNSFPNTQTAYEQPWNSSQTAFINHFSSTNHRHGGSLQKIPSTEKTKQNYSPPTFPLISPHQQSENTTAIPIDRYSWYHDTMSRRQAEKILQSRPSGSFLVRQSESGSQNDYSLSMKTTRTCMHMRICYSNGLYILGECSRPFSSVSSMIKYFTETFVPIRGAAHIKLSTPVLRWEIPTSSLSNEELL